MKEVSLNLNTNENVINKLKYIGLNFEEDIPDIIKDFRVLDYRPSKYNDEHVYKIYKYLNVKDIQILLSPTNRLCDIVEKYKKAVPLYEYLNPDKEENLERYTKFLSMVGNINIDKINEIEEEQKILNQKIPFKVKYPKDYLWQIYYSEYTGEYFMLVPTEDLEYSAFFYLLKKQLQNDYNQKIFVPISHVDYAREYLTRMQISDIENYLWFFTKEWPLVYEVYDKDDNLSVQITGKVYVYNDIQSDYKIILKNKEEAIKFYKFLKALFILQSEVPHHYNFELSVDEKGSIEFNINNKKVIYEILSSFVKEEYLKAEEEKIKLTSKREKGKKQLDKLQENSIKLEKEYLEKERQISTFLECRKTFFGRVKYFFKNKNKINKEVENEKRDKDEKAEQDTINLNQYSEIKEFYTIEELIDLYKIIDKEEIAVKNIDLDIKAIKQRIKNLESKVKNASLYIKEIDEHKKSIFDFWKFTNKDKQEELPEGEIKEEKRESLKKVFDYELDFEDLSKQLDNTQRELLSKKDLDSIFLTTTDILDDINKVAKGEEITVERLQDLKKQALEENILLEKENFDIFGSISYDNKLKILANQKHRESEKEIFKILDINKNTTIDEYTEEIKKVIENLRNCFDKIKMTVELPVYKCDITDILQNQYNSFNIKASDAIFETLKENSEKELYLYRLNIEEGTNIIAFTNSVYYDNTNKTLPLGMNVEEKILIDNKKVNIEKSKNKKINLVCYKEKDNQFSDIYIKQINIEEFN